VYVKAPPVLPALAPVYRGPYRVLVPGEKYFVLEVGGQPHPFSASNLKPHLGKLQPSPVSLPRRGHPRRSSPILSLAPGLTLGGGVVWRPHQVVPSTANPPTLGGGNPPTSGGRNL
jgi:hypothetical protein